VAHARRGDKSGSPGSAQDDLDGSSPILQPAVSHHIARLEAEVGTALITRLGRGVVVMSAAERRPPAVLAMLAALREASVALAATPEAAALGIRAA
jgi:DNA-binding transcriptional LysR family regulator